MILSGWQDSNVINTLLGEVIKSSIKVPLQSRFRVSSLPYCPVLNLYEDFHGSEDHNYSKGFYTSIGTAIHEVMQQFLPHHPTAKIFGNWQCSKCGNKIDHVFNKEAKKKLKCSDGKKCWPHVKYKELELLWKNLSGHTDMLIEIKGEVYLLDFKTTSSALWRETASTLKSKPFPTHKYGEQIETYAALIFNLYGIRIHHYVIVYVGRDGLMLKNKPLIRSFMKSFTKKMYEARMKRLVHFNNRYKVYKKFKEKASKSVIEDLVKNRPCHDTDSYAEMAKLRFDFSPCPNWQNYVCRTDSGVTQFLKDVSDLNKAKG
jgi:hypothetical protein